jgi:hypothetical protein
MKRGILAFSVLAILSIAPVAVFADLGIGGAALYTSPVLLGQPVDLVNMNVNQFSLGGDVRLKMGWIQGEALLLYSAGDISSLDLYLDVGLALDVAIIRLSLGAGPNLTTNFAGGGVLQAGLNAKASADVLLGPISIGVSYMMALDIGNGILINTKAGLVGGQILFWL